MEAAGLYPARDQDTQVKALRTERETDSVASLRRFGREPVWWRETAKTGLVGQSRIVICCCDEGSREEGWYDGRGGGVYLCSGWMGASGGLGSDELVMFGVRHTLARLEP